MEGCLEERLRQFFPRNEIRKIDNKVLFYFIALVSTTCTSRCIIRVLLYSYKFWI